MVGEVGIISCDYQSINLAGLVPCSGSLQRALPLAGGASPAQSFQGRSPGIKRLAL